jgi:hypothetical protein
VGTVGAGPLVGGEIFKVTVNNVTYDNVTPVNGVTVVVTGSGWTLDIPTALSAGVYEVKAERSTQYDQPGALPVVTLLVPDQSHFELVINNAPVLNDTPLVLAVTEDAGAPVNGTAVGSLLSAFTGGISDQDPGASKGIAVVGSNEASGTWYYTIDGGANWISLNQFNGAVSPTNALLLADNPNTRLYFAPNVNYEGSVTANPQLTIRAWDHEHDRRCRHSESGTHRRHLRPGWRRVRGLPGPHLHCDCGAACFARHHLPGRRHDGGYRRYAIQPCANPGDEIHAARQRERQRHF